MSEWLKSMLGEVVVLDTGTPIVYIGTLRNYDDMTFSLGEADMHDCRDGHASMEEYLAQANRKGVTVNRRSIVVMRASVISLSPLKDV